MNRMFGMRVTVMTLLLVVMIAASSSALAAKEKGEASHPWAKAEHVLKKHPHEVRKNGAEPCFQCHRETDCSSCHISL